MLLRRLLPPAREVEADEVIRGLGLGALAEARRPYVVANIVASADGRAALRGRSRPLGGEADREVFGLLRTQVDAVLVGAATLRAERYPALVRDGALRGRRVAEGLAPWPLAVVVSHSLDLPWDCGLLTTPDQPVAVFTDSSLRPPTAGSALSVLRHGAGELTLRAVLERLRGEHAVRSVLCEGGPRVLGALVADDLCDEFFLTVAPTLTGEPDAPRMLEGALPSAPIGLDVWWVLESDGFLFLRYARPRRAPAAR